MTDLSDFKSGQIVCARTADASVTKTAELFVVARSTFSKVMTAFEKQNSGRKRKLSDRDSRTLTRIVRKDRNNTAPKSTAELYDLLEPSFFQKL